jgi:hypothetical protein
MLTRRPLLTKPVFVGTSPAGVNYWARREGDTELLTASLKRHWAKATKTRRVSLTPGQADRIESLLSEEAIANFEAEGVTFRRTFVEGPVCTLADIAGFIDPESAADDAGMMASAQTPHEVLFAQRAGYAAALVLRAKLEGREIPMAKARKAAMKALF